MGPPKALRRTMNIDRDLYESGSEATAAVNRKNNPEHVHEDFSSDEKML